MNLLHWIITRSIDVHHLQYMYFNENISMILKQEMQRTKTEKKEQDLKGPYNIDNIFDI